MNPVVTIKKHTEKSVSTNAIPNISKDLLDYLKIRFPLYNLYRKDCETPSDILAQRAAFAGGIQEVIRYLEELYNQITE